MQRRRSNLSRVKKIASPSARNDTNVTIKSGAEEDRTPDPLPARQMLSQLSYSPKI